MSFDLLLFGGTADLTRRKLMPAWFQAFRHGKLPQGGRILSVARDERSDEKLKVLKSLKPFTPESVARDAVGGQYKAGTVEGKAVPGYLVEAKVRAASRCETFVALRTEVRNWRWAGVPFYLRTDKRLAGREAHIVVKLPRGAAPDLPWRQPCQQARHQAAARRRAAAAPDGCQRQRPWRAAGAGVAGPELRQGLPQRPRRRLLAAVARRHRRPAEPVRAQRRAGAGLALGGASARRLGQGHERPKNLHRRQLVPRGGQRPHRQGRLRLGRRAMTAVRRMSAWVDPQGPAKSPAGPPGTGLARERPGAASRHSS